MNFDAIVGKTILSVTQKSKLEYDDMGYLEVKFTDGTSCVIVGGYHENWTGRSEGEYPTTIGIESVIDDLIDVDE